MILNDYDEFNLSYDLDKIPEYTLPNPLILSNGKKIKDLNEWNDFRRQELINLFSHHLYGYIPGKIKNPKISNQSIDRNFLNSLATKKEIRIHFNKEIFIDLLIITPNNLVKSSPIFLGMNFFGNHSISKDNITQISKRIISETSIDYQKKNNMKKYLAKIRFNKESLLKSDLQQDNLGYDGIVHGGERIYNGNNLIGRIQFNNYVKEQDLYEAFTYLPIEFYGFKSELNVAIHQSFAKAKIVDFDINEMIGISSSRWPLKKIIENGYGVATFYYGDIDPDYDDGFQNGIHPLFYKKNQNYPNLLQ